jgi:hypothetical protein
MGRFIWIACALAWLGVLTGPSACAVETKIKNLRAVPYSKIACPKKVLGQETGVVQVLQPANDKMLVHVAFDLEVAWDKDTESLSFDESTLRVEAGKSAAAYRGEVLPTGELALQNVPYFSAFRPVGEDDKIEPSTTSVNSFWEVDGKAKEVVLHVGEQNATAKLEGEPQPYAPPPEIAVEVMGTTLHDSYQQTIGYDNKFSVELVNDGGSILELKLKLTPQVKDEEKLRELWSNLRSDRFYLSFGKGGRALALGHLDFEKRFADSNGLSLYPDKPAQPQMVTIFYPVPSDLKSFDVRYMGRTIAQGTVGE